MKFTTNPYKTIAISIFLIATLILAGCQAQQPNQQADDNVNQNTTQITMTFNIGSSLVDCVGVGPRTCMIVNEENFYDTIQGFEYQEGYTYQINVLQIEREEPIPADASKYRYELVEVISKVADVPTGCVSWFDGCNTCTVNADGTLGACTEKACFETQSAVCVSYEEDMQEEQEPRICCRALTASCLACDAGISVDEYCSNNPETVGCFE